MYVAPSYKRHPFGLFFGNRALVLSPRFFNVASSAQALQVRHVEGITAGVRVDVIDFESSWPAAFPASPIVPGEHGEAHPIPAPGMDPRDVIAAHPTSPK